MGAGNTRNLPCWCGSGVKFKRCHLGRAEEPRPNPGEFFDAMGKAKGRRQCFHPEAGKSTCSETIANAHTVRKMDLVGALAEEGHVLGFPRDYREFKQTGRSPDL